MQRLIGGIKKMKAKDENCPTGRWDRTYHLIQQNLSRFKRELKFDIPLSTATAFEPLLKRAKPSKVPGFLCTIIKDIDFDRMKEKQLASNLTERWRNNPFREDLEATNKGPVRCLNDTKISLPVAANKVKAIPNHLTNHTHVSIEVESRPLTRIELQQIRQNFAQRGDKCASYVAHLWERGAD